jgi:hemoglobin
MMFLDYNSNMTTPETTLYELIGGEVGLRALVEHFYDHMDSAPEAAQIRSLHPKSLKQAREKLFMFLSGWSGGPALYVQTYGHPRLRQRHMPFPIGKEERDQWLWCMDKALAESPFDAQLTEYLKGRFAEIANSMQNRVEIDL